MRSPARRPDRFLRRFLGRPTLGGWLTIANGVGVAILFLSAKSQEPAGPHGVIAIIMVAMCLILTAPVGLWLLLPGLDYHPTLFDIIDSAIMVGVNSFIWGYGLAWIIRKLGPRGDDKSRNAR